MGKPTHGVLSLNPDGSLTYMPGADFHGPDSFIIYQVSDGHGGTATATVAITVLESNDQPVGINDTVTTDEDSAVSGNVLSNDYDPDNTDGILGNEDTINPAVLTSGPSGGTLAFNPD